MNPIVRFIRPNFYDQAMEHEVGWYAFEITALGRALVESFTIDIKIWIRDNYET